MAKNIYVETIGQPTPQTEALPGREAEMKKNNAGGFSFALDDWKSLEKFLILGAEGGTYYVAEKELVLRNVAVLNRCIAADPARTAATIAEVSASGRAFKNDVAAFCVAYMASLGGAPRFAAYKILSKVFRTGRSFLEFHQSLDKLKVKSNMSRRKAYGRWLADRKPSELAYQALKYRTSGTLEMKDLIKYAHIKADAETMNVFAYLLEKEVPNYEGLPDIVHGWEAMKRTTTPAEAAALVQKHRLTWEFVLGQWQGDKDVWTALLRNLPYTALIRNLARISSYDLLAVGSDNAKYVRDRLTDGDNLRKARVHPMTLLIAWKTYAAGGSLGKTKLEWKVNSIVRDALEEAFYLAFDAIEPSGKSMLVGLDVSGSMSTAQIMGMPLVARDVSAVMAMVTLRAEKDSVVMGFDQGIRDLKLSKHDSLDAVLRKISNINAGGTNCSLPMVYALDNGMQIDQFVVLTDSETYWKFTHPAEMIKQYRQKTGIDAKMVVVGMTATDISIADPLDAGMIDVVGVDTQTPALISRFASGL